MAKLSNIYEKYEDNADMLNMARKFRRKLVKEKTSSRPLTGSYNWIPRPEPGRRWDMEFFADQEFGDTSHDVIWPKFVIPAIAQMWGLDATTLRRRLGSCYTALPRGRVCRCENGYQVIHGGDYEGRGWENKILRNFNLRKHKNEFIQDPHVGVLESDLEKFKNALGLQDLNIAIVSQIDEFQSSYDRDEPLSYNQTP